MKPKNLYLTTGFRRCFLIKFNQNLTVFMSSNTWQAYRHKDKSRMGKHEAHACTDRQTDRQTDKTQTRCALR